MVLLALANLREDGCSYFRRKLYFPNDPMLQDDRMLLKYRDQLRLLWNREPNWQGVLDGWLELCRANQIRTWVVSAWADGTYSVEPSDMFFPLSLAIAAGEWMAKMMVCGNPDCPAPYFLKTRKTQRFCERGPCVAYGQRQHALNWWNRVGAKRRAMKSKIRPKQSLKARENR